MINFSFEISFFIKKKRKIYSLIEYRFKLILYKIIEVIYLLIKMRALVFSRILDFLYL